MYEKTRGVICQREPYCKIGTAEKCDRAAKTTESTVALYPAAILGLRVEASHVSIGDEDRFSRIPADFLRVLALQYCSTGALLALD